MQLGRGIVADYDVVTVAQLRGAQKEWLRAEEMSWRGRFWPDNNQTRKIPSPAAPGGETGRRPCVVVCTVVVCIAA